MEVLRGLQAAGKDAPELILAVAGAITLLYHKAFSPIKPTRLCYVIAIGRAIINISRKFGKGNGRINMTRRRAEAVGDWLVREYSVLLNNFKETLQKREELEAEKLKRQARPFKRV